MDFFPNKKLGFGLMRMPTIDPNNDADVDVEQVKAMVDHFRSSLRQPVARRRVRS